MQLSIRRNLKNSLRNRERLFAGWVSYSQTAITETLARAGFDFMCIDMEHSTISLEQAQQIIVASQFYGVPCIPRPVSHSNDVLKPLLEAGSNGAMLPMVESEDDVARIARDFYYPPKGRRSFGVSRAQVYGFESGEYFTNWNDWGVLMIQIESVEGVENVSSILRNSDIDGVMVGPMDLSGSLGVPGQTDHPKVLEAAKHVIEECKRAGVSCGTQVSDPNQSNVGALFDLGYTYTILGSDLFALTSWARGMNQLMDDYRMRH